MSNGTPMNGEHTAPAGAGSSELPILLAEFEALREFKEQDTSIGDKRIDVLLTLAAGLGAGLGLLSQSGMDPRAFLFLAGFAAFGLLVIGLSTLAEVIDRNIDVVDYLRAINRIREHFAGL